MESCWSCAHNKEAHNILFHIDILISHTQIQRIPFGILKIKTFSFNMRIWSNRERERGNLRCYQINQKWWQDIWEKKKKRKIKLVHRWWVSMIENRSLSFCSPLSLFIAINCCTLCDRGRRHSAINRLICCIVMAQTHWLLFAIHFTSKTTLKSCLFHLFIC